MFFPQLEVFHVGVTDTSVLYSVVQIMKKEWIKKKLSEQHLKPTSPPILIFFAVTPLRGPIGGCFSSVQSLSCVELFVTPWTAAGQAFLSITNCRSLLKLISIESVKPSNRLILCRPLLLPPSVFPNIRVFSNESVLTWNYIREVI